MKFRVGWGLSSWSCNEYIVGANKPDEPEENKTRILVKNCVANRYLIVDKGMEGLEILH